MNIQRNILLNPGPATTTDTVKLAQIVPDICPRENEFAKILQSFRTDLLRIVHADPQRFTSVLFTGSGTINMDICLNSLLPANKKVLIINNGAYSARAVEICKYYGLQHINLEFSELEHPNLEVIRKTLAENDDISIVYATHHETGTGVLNPIREIGSITHQFGAIFVVDTTSSLAMIPIDMEKDNIDFCMASAQKGLMAMSGLSFIIGNKEAIIKSEEYPKRSYYCNLFRQYNHFEKTGEMHFTPPVQTVYAAIQALKEYFEEGEIEKWHRHLRVYHSIRKGIAKLGFKEAVNPSIQSGLVVSIEYPTHPNWNFNKVHDYCIERGYTIYPGKISKNNTFRLCSLGAIDVRDIDNFLIVFEDALNFISCKINNHA